MSLGYAFSVLAIVLALAWLFRDALGPWGALHLLGLGLYGLRLGSFLLRRERRPFVWLGSFLAGLPALGHPVQWAAALTGLVCIELIMMGSTKRLEGKQDERYGEDPDFQAYRRSVPVLFPFVPVYSLKNVKVYLE